jgi:hypothetical protein
LPPPTSRATILIHFGLKLYYNMDCLVCRLKYGLCSQHSELLLYRKWPIATKKGSSSEHPILQFQAWPHARMRESAWSLNQPSGVMVTELSIISITSRIVSNGSSHGKMLMHEPQYYNLNVTSARLSTRRSRKYGWLSPAGLLNA